MDNNGVRCTSCQDQINTLNNSGDSCLLNCTGQWLGPGLLPSDPLICTNYTPSKIINCQTPHPLKDECQLCQMGFVRDSVSHICLAMNVIGCVNNGDSRDQNCIGCAPHHIYQSNVCVALPPVLNCSQYVINSALCAQCLQGFYFSQDRTQCLRITARDCIVNAMDADKCLLCTDNTFTISNDGRACFLGRTTTHCIVSTSIDSSSECLICESGMISANGTNTCITDIFNLLGCTKVSLDSSGVFYVCKSCSDNYISQNNMCIPSQKISTCQIHGCKTFSSINFDSAVCKQCETIENSNSRFELVDNVCHFILYADLIGITIIFIIISLLL